VFGQGQLVFPDNVLLVIAYELLVFAFGAVHPSQLVLVQDFLS
jgi:hypothetical protein